MSGKDKVGDDENQSRGSCLHGLVSADTLAMQPSKRQCTSSSAGLQQRKPSSTTKGKEKMVASSPRSKAGSRLPFWMYESYKEKPLQIGKSTAEKPKSSEANIGASPSNETTKKDIRPEDCTPPQPSSAAAKSSPQEGFPLQEMRILHPTRYKLTCCDFSTRAKFLVAGGHEKKVFVWNLNQSTKETTQGHAQLISDVRFRPNSYIFATASFDKSIKIWDAAASGKLLCDLVAHDEHVMSLDFHPINGNLLCSSDSSDVIKFWDVKESLNYHTMKGGSRRVRFQPGKGNLLAAASGNFINLINMDSGFIECRLQGHTKEVRSISWDNYGQYLVSVSENSARIWSVLSGGMCVQELQSNGIMFESCTFHPVHAQIVVIGSYQTIEIWNPAIKQVWTIPAHEGIVSALASSTDSKMIASASHDQSIKLWK